MKQRWFVASIFVVGCVTGSVASQLVVPPVRAGTQPVRSEYLCGSAEYGRLTATLNQLGAQGWELVTASHVPGLGTSSFCAKRALP